MNAIFTKAFFKAFQFIAEEKVIVFVLLSNKKR